MQKVKRRHNEPRCFYFLKAGIETICVAPPSVLHVACTLSSVLEEAASRGWDAYVPAAPELVYWLSSDPSPLRRACGLWQSPGSSTDAPEFRRPCPWSGRAGRWVRAAMGPRVPPCASWLLGPLRWPFGFVPIPVLPDSEGNDLFGGEGGFSRILASTFWASCKPHFPACYQC